MPIAELQTQIKNKNISPVELVKMLIEKAERKNKQINAFISIQRNQALKQAKQAEKEIMQGNHKSPLHGVPVGVKDIINVKGTATTCASALNINNISADDAEIVKRLKNSGAIIFGKENMHSFAYGSTGDISYFGPVKNPLDHSKIAGGSSSGSSAAVASDLSFGSVGSDTGGSIRIPAAFCGVVGMKPTFGSISRYGTVSLAPTLDTLGTITKTVQDNALMLESIAGYDVKDPFSVTSAETDYSDVTIPDMTKKIIGVPTQYYFDIIDPEIKELFDQTVEELTLKGFQIKFIDVPYMEEFDAALSIIFATEVYESLEKDVQERPEKIEEEIRDRILEGYFIKAHEYISMFRVKNLAIEVFTNLLNQVDVLMTPTLCAYPSEIGKREISVNGEHVSTRGMYSRLVRASNLTGFPALSLPSGVSDAGIANSIQLIGLPFHEKELYSFGKVIEQL